MTRFASAPWPLKAAYVGTLATAGVALLGGLTALIALAGLKRLSPDIDPAQQCCPNHAFPPTAALTGVGAPAPPTRA